MITNKNNSKLMTYFLRTRPLKFLLGGIFLGAIDNLIFLALGIDMQLNGYDVNIAVAVFFSLSFGAFTWIIGALLETNKEMMAAHKELQEKETLATVGRLAAGVAHEVRNPLTVIRSSAKLIQNDSKPEGDTYTASAFIVTEVDRLNDFVGSLLDYCRPIHLETSCQDLKQIITEAWDLLPHTASHTLDLSRLASQSILVDRQTFVPMLVGLFRNSLQAMERGGEIIITNFCSGNSDTIEIADQGPGIDLEHSDQLFSPFFTTKADGTGLGLAMAKKVVESHCGEIHYDHSQSKGAHFIITLPRGE